MKKMTVTMLLLCSSLLLAQQFSNKPNQPHHPVIKESDTPIPVFSSGISWYPDSTIENTATYSYKKLYSFDANNNRVLWEWYKNTGSGWENYRKYTYSYDTQGNRTSYTEYDWDGTDWIADWRYQFTYNTSGKLTVSVRQTWDGSAWVDDWKTEYTYDGQGNTAMHVNYRWSGAAWTENHRYLMTYDAFNNLITDTYQTWDGSNWVDDTRYAYAYDGEGNMLSFTLVSWNGTAWQNQERTLNYYDSAGNVLIHEEYDWTGTEWAEILKYDYTYSSSNKLLTETLSLWRSDTWVYDAKKVRTFNSSDYLTQELSSVWRSSAWKDTIKFEVSYLPGSVELLYTTHDGTSWNSSNGFLSISEEPFDKYSVSLYGYEATVYYREVTGINDKETAPAEFKLAQNYPNPFNPSTTIKFTLPERGMTELKVYDMLGREVSLLLSRELEPGTYSFKFNGEHLSSGMYIYRLVSGNYSCSAKMLLLK